MATGKDCGISEADYRELVEKGAAWSIEKGYGFAKDLEHIESHGVIQGADTESCFARCYVKRARSTWICGIRQPFCRNRRSAATLFYLRSRRSGEIEKGQTYILIHSGSRGFGHQICQDTLINSSSMGYAEGLPDKQLGGSSD